MNQATVKDIVNGLKEEPLDKSQRDKQNVTIDFSSLVIALIIQICKLFPCILYSLVEIESQLTFSY